MFKAIQLNTPNILYTGKTYEEVFEKCRGNGTVYHSFEEVAGAEVNCYYFSGMKKSVYIINDKTILKQTKFYTTGTKKKTKEKEKAVAIDLFYGSNTMKSQNLLMRSADVFELGKQLAVYERIVITGTMDIENIIETVKSAYEKAGGYVVFAAIYSINGTRSKRPRAYIKQNVQTISNGKKRGLLRDLLMQLGYSVKTDERQHVLSVGYNHSVPEAV